MAFTSAKTRIFSLHASRLPYYPALAIEYSVRNEANAGPPLANPQARASAFLKKLAR